MVMVRSSAKVVKAESDKVAKTDAEVAKAVAPKEAKKVTKAEKVEKKPKVTDEEAKGLRVGYTTGMRAAEYQGLLLTNNEKDKLNDEGMAELFLAEFPRRDSCQPFARLRSWFNSGTYAAQGLSPGGKPAAAGHKPADAERSHCYVDGKLVEPKVAFGHKTTTPKTKTPEAVVSAKVVKNFVKRQAKIAKVSAVLDARSPKPVRVKVMAAK